jgi:hypothetical protein
MERPSSQDNRTVKKCVVKFGAHAFTKYGFCDFTYLDGLNVHLLLMLILQWKKRNLFLLHVIK